MLSWNRGDMEEIVKKSRHIPRKDASNKNILRCMILSIEERASLTCQMCGDKLDKKTYLKMLNILVDKGIAVPIENGKCIENTTDLLISDYEKADYFTKSSFRNCLIRIEKDLVPLFNIAAASINLVSSIVR